MDLKRGPVTQPHPEAALPVGAEDLLRRTGIHSLSTATRMTGGRNNRVFRIDYETGRSVVLKAYFRDPQDPRDRLAAEFCFLEAANRLGIECVARPLARDEKRHLGLYSFIDGVPIPQSDLSAQALRQALDFILRLNQRHHRPSMVGLTKASEACFSLTDHITTVESRLHRLQSGFGDTVIEIDAARFISNEVRPLWRQMQQDITSGYERAGLALETRLHDTMHILSPSDFGFHNALRNDSGDIYFVDFEYAGWDDPAKLVGDAFNQVKVPLLADFYPTFRDAIAQWTGQAERERLRYDLLLPLYAIKWITIALNEFLPGATRRRTFADPTSNTSERRAVQLEVAKAKLTQLRDGLSPYFSG